jgi:hypothetical protein
MNRGAIRTMVRRRIQEEEADDWSDNDLNTLINVAYALVAKQVRKVNPTFLLHWEHRDTVAGTNWYEMPEGSRGPVDIGLLISSGSTDVQYLCRASGEVARQNTNESETVYTLMGDFIGIFPAPSQSVTNGLLIIHVPTPTLAEDTDVPKLEATLHYAIVCWTALLAKGESPEDDTKEAKELSRILSDIPDDYGQDDFSQPPKLSPDVSDARGKYGSQLDNGVDPGRN